MKKISIFLSALISVHLVGCSTVPTVKEPVTQQMRLESSLDEVWPKIVSIVAVGGNKVNVIEKESGIIVFTRSLSKDEVARYSDDKSQQPPWPIGPMGAHYGFGEAVLTLNIRPSGETASNITLTNQMTATLCTFDGEPVIMNKDKNQRINSNGELEKYVFGLIRSQIHTAEIPLSGGPGKVVASSPRPRQVVKLPVEKETLTQPETPLRRVADSTAAVPTSSSEKVTQAASEVPAAQTPAAPVSQATSQN